MLGWIAAAAGAGALALVGGWVYVSATVEEPPFTAVETDGDFELRDYPALTVAEVTRPGSRGEAVRSGFSPLAGYIFAREREGEKIAMTAPVTQQRAGEAWAVHFIMPHGRTPADLPPPAPGESVRLVETPPVRRATVRFSGVADDALLAEQTARLEAWIAAKGLRPTGEPPLYAYYNDPFTPGFLRRNEVMIAVEETPAGV